MAFVTPSGNGSGVFVPVNAPRDRTIADSPGLPIPTAVVDTYAADLLRSEGLRQADVATARKKFGLAGPLAFEVQSDIDTLNADLKTADINHLLRLYASRVSNCLDVAGMQRSLQDLGVSV